MRWWKVLGLAGAVGLAATGAAVARAERRRRAYTPEQVRERLHARHAETVSDEMISGGDESDARHAGGDGNRA